MFVTNTCTTGILEQTTSHEIENDLNYNEKSSLILDYLVLTRKSATKQNDRLDHDRPEKRMSDGVIWCQGFLYSDETCAHHTLCVLMKTLGSNEETKARVRNEKYEIHIWIMSSRICTYPEC